MNSIVTIIVRFFAVASCNPAPQGSTTTPVSLESDGTEVQDVGTLKQIQVPNANGTGTEQVQVLVQTGSFSYPSPDGQQIQLNYTADETGFHPQGAHLPVAPETL
ncbi:hypothetical protein quinque_009852 [Culex quinquefasciatus]